MRDSNLIGIEFIFLVKLVSGLELSIYPSESLLEEGFLFSFDSGCLALRVTIL